MLSNPGTNPIPVVRAAMTFEHARHSKACASCRGLDSMEGD